MASGPMTGKLVAQLISGEKTDISLDPFRATRF
jgi:glycine/D-amino acid oxidase-like deaminating enzyme